MKEQEKDENLIFLWPEAKRSEKVDGNLVSFYVDIGVLMRSWGPLEVPAYEYWKMKKQIIVPQVHRHKILAIAHEGNLTGYMGIR